MNPAHEYLMKRIKSIEALRLLKKKIDPASGMAVCVRRGVAQDGEDEDPDRRPWNTTEMIDMPSAEKVIDLLIASEEESAKFWERRVKEEIKAGEKALSAYQGTD